MANPPVEIITYLWAIYYHLHVSHMLYMTYCHLQVSHMLYMTYYQIHVSHMQYMTVTYMWVTCCIWSIVTNMSHAVYDLLSPTCESHAVYDLSPTCESHAVYDWHVDGTPMSEITLVTIPCIYPPHHGQRKVSAMVRNGCLTSLSYHVNWPSRSWDGYFKFWPWNVEVKAMSVVKGQGNVVIPASNGLPSFFIHINHTNSSWDTAISKFDHEKIQGQGHGWDQRSRSYSLPSIQSMQRGPTRVSFSISLIFSDINGNCLDVFHIHHRKMHYQLHVLCFSRSLFQQIYETPQTSHSEHLISCSLIFMFLMDNYILNIDEVRD